MKRHKRSSLAQRRAKAIKGREERYGAWLKQYGLPIYWLYMVKPKEQEKMMRTNDCGPVVLWCRKRSYDR